MMNYPTNPEIYSFGLNMPMLFSEGVCLEYDYGFVLKYIFDRPTAKERNAISNGIPQFGIAVVNNFIFFLSRFGSLNWTDAPFSIHLYPDNRITSLKEPGPAQGYGLRVELFDSVTGILVRQRQIVLDHDLSTRLYDAIVHQPVILNYHQRIKLTMAMYTTKDLVRLGHIHPVSKEQIDQVADVPKLRPSHRGLIGIQKDNYRLPKKLRKFNFFYPDMGHVVMAIPKSILPLAIEDGDFDGYECPVPCRYILKKGYHFHEGYVVCDVPYDEKFGVDLDESWYEE